LSLKKTSTDLGTHHLDFDRTDVPPLAPTIIPTTRARHGKESSKLEDLGKMGIAA
jgi:hypothetical protein